MPPPPPSGTGSISASSSASCDLDRGLLLDPVAVHVDRFEDPRRQVLLLRCGQLGDEEVQEDRQLLPLGVGVGQDRRQELVGAHERLGLALELDLPVFVEVLLVDGDAGIEDRVELVAVGARRDRGRTKLRRPAS